MILIIKDYLWFIKESQMFMKGYNPIIIFLKSLYKGIWFCKDMHITRKLSENLKDEEGILYDNII